MNDSPRRTVYALSVSFWLLIVLAVVAPRLVVGSEKGLAAGATAAVTFLVLAILATIIASVLFFRTLRARAVLNTPAKWAGLLPLPLVIFGGTILWSIIQH